MVMIMSSFLDLFDLNVCPIDVHFLGLSWLAVDAALESARTASALGLGSVLKLSIDPDVDVSIVVIVSDAKVCVAFAPGVIKKLDFSLSHSQVSLVNVDHKRGSIAGSLTLIVDLEYGEPGALLRYVEISTKLGDPTVVHIIQECYLSSRHGVRFGAQ